MLTVVCAETTAMVLLVSLFAGLAVHNLRRMRMLLDRLRALTENDLTSPVPHMTAYGPVGAMARGIRALCDTRTGPNEAERAAEQQRAQTEIRQAATDRHIRDFTESLAGVMRGLAGTAQHMDIALQGMAISAGRAGDRATSTTETARGSAEELKTVAASTEGLTSRIGEISDAVARATETAQGMSQHATVTENRMAGLAGAADKIGDVARMIGAIARQTNLLALNATIEAARAGNAGKGFAVVASEVKQLARQTADATGDITSQIAAIQAATADAVAAVRQMAAEVRQMQDMAAEIVTAVSQQSDSVRHIAGSIAAVAVATDDAVSAMAEAAEAAEEARFTSSEVWYAAGNVGTETETLVQEFDYFQQFLLDDSINRRTFQRVDCAEAPLVVHLPDDDTAEGFLLDLSRGGLALRVTDPAKIAKLASGTKLRVSLPDGLGDVSMRVVRIEASQIGFVACQTTSTSESMDKAFSYFMTLRKAA
jgi:methyl-accepting chemotaxis protein